MVMAVAAVTMSVGEGGNNADSSGSDRVGGGGGK